jgi:hypothetical protein
VLADQIHDAPAVVALPDVRERERRRFGAALPALFLYRLLRDQCELAQVVIIERALGVGGLI